ncbi:DUF692 domain-containing protein [Bailinhaonella thermotolerans]|uniref:DUF692 domain-containing protein n=1 Tax=Bailinhaonella thermotolerans TaxID=1070861 RepID=UPI00192A31A8|nr:DUF692 domain-containing protein [Bailinhaonella thermotolerans]
MSTVRSTDRNIERSAVRSAEGAAGDHGGFGVGIGWRPELDLTVERLPGIGFVEVIAETLRPPAVPESLRILRDRGVRVVPHGVGLGIGGADPPDPRRLEHLARCAEAVDAPLVSEHLAFVRGGGLEAGHLLPVPRTRESLDILTANVRLAQAALPVPLALENVSAIFAWPGEELGEAEFLAELVARTGVHLLVDVANLHNNRVNLGLDPLAALDALPLGSLAYVHVAGGYEVQGVWHDTHTRPPTPEILTLLAELCRRHAPAGVLLEWDADYPSDSALAAELDRIRSRSRTAPWSPSVHERPSAPGPLSDGSPRQAPAGDGPETDASRRGPEPTGEGPVSGGSRWPARAAEVPEGGAPPRLEPGEEGSAGDGSRRPATGGERPEGDVPRWRPEPGRAGPEGGSARDRLAAAQAAVVAHLVAAGPLPEGFDPDRMRVQARSLVAKRRDDVARSWPSLAASLGDDYSRLFFGYASGRPKPPGGSRADATAFAAWLAGHHRPTPPAIPTPTPSAPSPSVPVPSVPARAVPAPSGPPRSGRASSSLVPSPGVSAEPPPASRPRPPGAIGRVLRLLSPARLFAAGRRDHHP